MSTAGKGRLELSEQDSAPQSRGWNHAFRSREMSLVLIILVVCAVLAAVKREKFLNADSFEAIASGMIYDLLMASGMTLVLILGGIDLSVGSVLALTGVVTTMLLGNGVPVPLSVALGLAAAVGAGALNGVCVAGLRIAPFIVTLGMMSIARGAAYVLTQGYFQSGLPEGYVSIARDELLGIPYPVVITFGLLIAFDWLLRNWKPLSQAYYIGANPAAAALSGIRVRLVTFAGYAICSLLAGLAAIFQTSDLAMGSAMDGQLAELRAIAAAVIGGASLTGGTGSVFGACLGVLLLAVINYGFVLLGGSPNWQQAVSGGILLVAVGVNAYRSRRIRTE